MPSPTPFTPDVKTAALVIQRFCSPSQSLAEIAHDFGTDLHSLVTWINTPPIQRTLDTLEAEACARVRAHARRALALLQLHADCEHLFSP